ncbi:hypothetical protein [Parapontixanthobacter aurantiacus]|uniref:hypothetical protein n=1 Tax=Parapontixanthobacter aurantiacus TaxID=1463599 RepID=UPI0019269B95|nr:hypothetical protein [Parapontixanthobacter aurantiacus]
MPVIGCLLLIVLPLLGVIVGSAIGGDTAMTIGALAGVALALGFFVASAIALKRARK